MWRSWRVRDYSGHPVSDEEWTRVFAAFGPRVPDGQQLARRVQNPELGFHGMERLRDLDVSDQLAGVDCPTLVCVGELDPVTPVDASREIVSSLHKGVGRLEVIEHAGHFPWLDVPTTYWTVIEEFITAVTTPRT